MLTGTHTECTLCMASCLLPLISLQEIKAQTKWETDPMGEQERARKADLCPLSLIRLAKDKLRVTHRFYLLQPIPVNWYWLPRLLCHEGARGLVAAIQKTILGSTDNVCHGHGMLNQATHSKMSAATLGRGPVHSEQQKGSTHNTNTHLSVGSK